MQRKKSKKVGADAENVSALFTQNADLKIKNRYIMEVTDLYEDTFYLSGMRQKPG